MQRAKGVALDLDETATARRASAVLGQPIETLTRLPGGSSGLTYLAHTGEGPRVVKVAPPGLPPVRNRDVLRQARLLAHLATSSAVAVPAVLGVDPGAPPDTPPLFVMAFVNGESIEPLLDADARLSADRVDQRSRAASRMLAALHQTPLPVDSETPAALIEKVTRWVDAFRTVDDDLKSTYEDVGRRLARELPTPLAPAIVHGDWRLGNMLCLGVDVHAVIDWEIFTISDPRFDLAWFELFSDPLHPLRARTDAHLADVGMLRAEYVAAHGDALADMPWFEAHARFKQAAAGALLVKNSRRRPRPGFDADGPTRSIPILLDAARERLG